MMRGLLGSRTVITIISILGLTSTAFAFVYVVKEHDTLSTIAKKYIKGPAFGKNGNIAKILAQNPEIKDPNLIYTNQKINLTPTQVNQITDAHPESTEASKAQESQVDRKISAVEPTPSDGSGTVLELTPFFAMSSLTSTDQTSGSRSRVASGLDVGIDARYYQTWNADFKTYIRGKLNYISFATPLDSSKSISNGTKYLTTFGIGARKQFSNRFRMDLSADLEQNLFLRGLSTTSVSVDTVLTPSLGAKLGFDLVQMNAFTMGLTGVYEAKFQASTDVYNVKLGSLYGGAIGVKQRVQGEDKFEVSLGAFARSQNTDVTDQTETTYVLSLKLLVGSSQ